MFKYTSTPLQDYSGTKYLLFQDDQSLSFQEVIDLWKKEEAFRLFFNDILVNTEYKAFYWETQPITTNRLDNPFEFVVINSTHLVNKTPEIRPFKAYFDTPKNVVSFPNLGKNAELIVPTPIIEHETYTHLGNFVRLAPPTQIQDFWQGVGEVYEQEISDVPRWLSTAGLGVYWLHVRVDTRPKYYRYRPYKTI